MATARPFTYNTGSTISGTEQIGNLAIGQPISGFDSTGLRWWNGPDEDLGYVIAHETPLGNQPNPVGVPAYLGFWRSTGITDSSFISLAEWVSNYNGTPQTFTATTQAKTWLNNNGYWTSYNSLVTDGLTQQLDASNSSSYPGTGNTWSDLVAPKQDISLVGSPTFTPTSPSYFTFNGSSQYGTGSGTVIPTTAYTKSVWFYLNGTADNNLVSSSSGGHFMFFASTSKLYCGHANWPSYTVFGSTTTFNLNTWYCATLTFNTTDGMILYVNGIQDATYTANKSARGGDGSTNLACFSPAGNLLNGRISKVYCYNRSLSASEVLQNYNTDKSQFGL